MSNLGRLYVFEGCDGSGKTTLARSFSASLSNGKQRVRHVCFPGNTEGTLGKHVYDLHHAPGSAGIESIHPASLQILHIAAHTDSIESVILPALNRGEWVVLDRYWWSTWIYGIVSGVDRRALKMMIALELFYWSGTIPAAVFLIERKGNTVKDEDIKQSRIICEYNKLADLEAKNCVVHKINNDQTVEQTLRTLLEAAKL